MFREAEFQKPEYVEAETIIRRQVAARQKKMTFAGRPWIARHLVMGLCVIALALATAYQFFISN